MKVLIIGKGGRENALAWKISQSNLLSQLFIAPGNAGTEKFGTNIDIAEEDNYRLLQFALQEKIDFTLVGPETPLMAGIVDLFIENNLKIFGPIQKAAMIEGSKTLAKEIMLKYNIPTAKYKRFTEPSLAMAGLRNFKPPYVIKADNLAAGKGVIIANDDKEAVQAISTILIDKKFNSESLIIEEFLEGIEFSFMALVNGTKVEPLEIAQDFKKIGEGDSGLNTGGMGAVSPCLFISPALKNEALNRILVPMAEALVAEGRYYKGILYGGLILTKEGIKVIEFNARLGDPETEVVLPRLKSDLLEALINFDQGKNIELVWEDNYCLGVVISTQGYPAEYPKNIPIKIPQNSDLIFHMGTKKLNNKNVVNNGGRVCIAVGLGNSPQSSRTKAYTCLKKIKFDKGYYRSDIQFRI